jgi:hypothetical protein
MKDRAAKSQRAARQASTTGLEASSHVSTILANLTPRSRPNAILILEATT